MAFSSYAFQTTDVIRNWIGGRWVESSSGETFDVINPRYGKTITQVTMGTAEDAKAAVAAAKAAFPAWKATPIKERAQVFYKLKSLLERDFEELCWLVVHENGKTYAEAKGSVAKTIECVEFGCSLPNVVGGDTQYVSRGTTCSMYHEPLGVCVGVTPFNFPLMVPMWMLPQAIVAGNTFILKPSEQVAISPARLALLFKEAGLPDGVFNVLNGGPEVVQTLCDDPEVKAFGFVGSSTVAKELYGRSAQTGRRSLCLGSAKNHLIVIPDADVEMTAHDVVRSYSGVAGQRCMAASALVTVGDCSTIVERIVEKSAAMVTGEDMGPIINKASYDRILNYLNKAEEQGAKFLLDGRDATVEGAPEGYWIGPTIIEVTPDMPAYQDEIFGPVLSIVKVDTIDEAIELENAHMYGNGGSVYTTSGATARYVATRINAGMTGINIGIPVPREPFSFGGWEASKFGHGDITGIDGFHFWTRPRKLTIKWGLQPDATWMS